MDLGGVIVLGFSLYLLITVPRKKYEKKIQEANRKLNGIVNRIDQYEDQTTIDMEVAREIKQIMKSDLGLGDLGQRKINIKS